MPLESPDTIDLIVTPSPDTIHLVITDSGAISDGESRQQAYQQKLATYAAFLVSEEFAAKFPGADADNIAIRVITPAKPLDPISSLSIADGVVIPIFWEEMPSR